MQQGCILAEASTILLETPVLEGAKVGEGVQKDLFYLHLISIVLTFTHLCTQLNLKDRQNHHCRPEKGAKLPETQATNQTARYQGTATTYQLYPEGLQGY